jgi:hypothetical protein
MRFCLIYFSLILTIWTEPLSVIGRTRGKKRTFVCPGQRLVLGQSGCAHGTYKSAWSISVPPEKLAKIIEQVDRVAKLAKVSVKDLQSLIGRLLWLTSAWHYLRPLLIPLYRALHHIPTTVVGMDHVTFQSLVSPLSPSLNLTQDLPRNHESLCRHVRLMRVANTNVHSLEDIQKLYLKSRRVWVGIQDPSSPTRTLNSESHEALKVWAPLLGPTPFTLSMAPPAYVEVKATADAMASKNLAGLGASFQMEAKPGSNFRSRWNKHNHCGHGSEWICRSTLQRGNCWLNLPFRIALSCASQNAEDQLPATKGQIIVRQTLPRQRACP